MSETEELVTGRSGKDHVGSDDVGAYNARTVGDGCYIMGGCACTMANANTAHIAPGDVLVEGRHFRVKGEGVDLKVESGTQNMNRNDLVVLRYTKTSKAYDNGETGYVEDCRLVIVKGAASSGTPVDPKLAAGSILAGSDLAEHALYRIPIRGTSTVGAPEVVCEKTEPMHKAVERIDKEAAEVVPPSRGGSGKTTLLASLGAFVASAPENTTPAVDSSRFLMPTTSGGAIWRSGANIWTWIAGKVRSVFGFSAANVLAGKNGGTGAANERDAANNLLVQSIARATALPVSADLNNYKTPGNFVSPNADVSKTLKNCPISTSGMRLTVWGILSADKAGSDVLQVATVWISGKTYYRAWNPVSSVWTSWYLSPVAAVTVGMTAAQEAAAWRAAMGVDEDTMGVQSIRYGTEIASKANLNNITTPGNYVSKSADVSATLANAPITTGGFRLTVMRPLGTTDAANGGALSQLADIWTTGERYWRSWTTTGGWTAWYRMPCYVSGKDAWGYNTSSDLAYLGLNSNVTLGNADKTSRVRGTVELGTAGKAVKVLGNLAGKLSGLGANGANGTIYKRLWTGTLAVGGKITVPGLSNYSVIIAVPAGEATAMIGARNVVGGGFIRCDGALDDGGTSSHGSSQSYQASFTVSGEELTLVGASSYYLLDGHSVKKSIGAIWGLI